MIKIENTEVVGWEHAIRGMRNPMNSWEKSDSLFEHMYNQGDGYSYLHNICGKQTTIESDYPIGDSLGPIDHDLMMRLCKAGAADAKFRRMIICYADITAPLYILKEMDTYRMGVEKNSCSTMHKIASKEFTLEDFSCEHLLITTDASSKGIDIPYIPVDQAETVRTSPNGLMNVMVSMLNACRSLYLETKDKAYWWQMIQLLPSSYNQRRTYMFSYEALSKIYRERRNHKLDEWHQFCDWVETLPYSEIITLKEEKADE